MKDKTPRQGTVTLELRFKSPQSARSCLTRLSSLSGVILNNLRGRVTAHEAVYQVELSGRDSSVAQAVWGLQAVASSL